MVTMKISIYKCTLSRDLTLFAALDECKSVEHAEIEEGITKWMESCGTAIQEKWNT